MLLGSIEAGGTKFVCAVGNEDYRIMDSTKFPTTTPAETLQKCIDYFKQFNDLQAISIASFGPIEIRRNSPKYGYITNTPKPGWADTDFVGTLKKAINVPIAWTTDVNGSAYGEYVLSTLFNQRLRSLVYFTIGTGVGGGAVVDGHFLGDLGHPEMGHIRVIQMILIFQASVRFMATVWKVWSAGRLLRHGRERRVKTCRLMIMSGILWPIMLRRLPSTRP